MKHAGCLILFAILAFAGCDPDTSPIPKNNEADASAGSAGSGTGGAAGQGGSLTGGSAGTAGAAGSTDDAGPDAEQEGGDAGEAGAAGSTNAWNHTITIDGVNDFDPSTEKFATSSSSPDVYSGYLTWDTFNLYLGMEGPALQNASDMDWVVAYISGTPGTQQGITYNSQSPALPFEARYHVRWKANSSYTNAQRWDGSAWVDASWTIAAKAQGTFVEMALARLDFGSATSIKVVWSMMREKNGQEWTWAGVPSTSIVDGKDPDYTKYFEFNLDADTAPNAYPILP